jgi:protein-S-isoprenylcysteine O-methyltransferase Ste14
MFFGYGVLAHLCFLAVFAYLAGFVGNLLVPKSIDSPSALSTSAALGIDVLLIVVFGLQHSIMARPAFKRVWTQWVAQPIERSTYVWASSFVTLLLVWQWQGVNIVVWDVTNPVARAVLWAIFAMGWLLVPGVTLLIDHFDLFGTRQVWLFLRKAEYTHHPFSTPLFYKHVRHPLYVGWAIAFWATPTMTVGHLLFAAGMSLYMVLAVQFEERDLVNHFGGDYESYRKRVPMFVPRFSAMHKMLDFHVLTDPSWWQWAVTVPMLVAHLIGQPWALPAALVLCSAMTAYYLIRLHSVRPMPVQIRLAYMAWLLVGLLPGMVWMHYVALIGTTAMVLFGYCPLARTLTLLPLNRTEEFSMNLVGRTILAKSTGGLLHRWSDGDTSTANSCSLRVPDSIRTERVEGDGVLTGAVQ